MAESAPAIERAFSVMAFLAEHPRQAFSLSELAREVGISKATCHAMFASMVRSGAMVRNPHDGRFRLGPALIALGAAVAPEGERAVEYARAEMAALSAELGVVCIASIKAGDEIIVRARHVPRGVGPIGGQGAATLGTRAYWMPPVGPVFAAWAAPEVTETWLARSATDSARRQYGELLAHIRKVGYDVSYAFDVRARLLEEVAVARMGDPEDIQRLVTRIVENTEPSPIGIVSGRVNAVRTIQAPVLGPNGEAVLMVALARLPQPLSKRTASGFGRELLAACERISSALAA